MFSEACGKATMGNDELPRVGRRLTMLGPLSLHVTCLFVYHGTMLNPGTHRLNVTLDAERATRLAQLAERTQVQEGTLARSLLSRALDEADPDTRHIVELLDGLGGAYERAQLGLSQVATGETTKLDDF